MNFYITAQGDRDSAKSVAREGEGSGGSPCRVCLQESSDRVYLSKRQIAGKEDREQRDRVKTCDFLTQSDAIRRPTVA